MEFDYDLFVIGGGSGGVRAARVSAGLGARVALAEDSRLGGTCVIRGCVPKKLMVFASSYREGFSDARAYGWDVGDASFNWDRFATKMRAELDRLESVYRGLLEGSNVTIFDSRAQIADPHTIELADGTRKTAAHILVATGGHPTRPGLANDHLGIVSDDIFDLRELPQSILIVGGGYIACEFACILRGMGAEVTQFYRGAQVLRGFDEEARGLVAEVMRNNGIDLHLGTNIVDMAQLADATRPEHMMATMGAPAQERSTVQADTTGGPIWVKSTNGREYQFDAVLFATGRSPNTSGIGLAQAGVRLGRKGQILVNEYSQTDVPSIYAIGDVTDRVNLTPVAIREGMAFAQTVFGGTP
ncbi:MAG: FAD-dependent oxidoreductase, partial [Pseudomonadota bacterium]